MAKKSKSKKRIFIIGGIIAFLSVFVLANIFRDDVKALKVDTEFVSLRTVVQKVNASGTIQPETEVKISAESTAFIDSITCLLYTSPSPRDVEESRMPSSA